MLALVHFYAGPFVPQPPIEVTVAEKAVAIRDATVAALRGEELETESSRKQMDIDQIVWLVTAVLGGIALVLGVFASIAGKSRAIGVGGAVLGASAIAFQFMTISLGVIVLVVLVGAVLAGLGVGFG